MGDEVKSEDAPEARAASAVPLFCLFVLKIHQLY